LVATSSGLDATFLGADLPVADIVEMTTVTRSEVLVLGVTLQEEDFYERTLAEIRSIVAAAPQSVEVWIGGPAATAVSAAIGGRVLGIPDYETLETQLTRVGGRF
jgi:hypothetical protein